MGSAGAAGFGGGAGRSGWGRVRARRGVQLVRNPSQTIPSAAASRITMASAPSSESTSGLTASTAAADEVEHAVQPPTDPRPRAETRRRSAGRGTAARPPMPTSTAVCWPERAPSTRRSPPRSISASWCAQNGTVPGRAPIVGAAPSGQPTSRRTGAPGSLRRMDPTWARHLPDGVRPDSVDLLARRSLPAAWAEQWAAAPERPAIHDAGAWHDATVTSTGAVRAVAARSRAPAGLRDGDRVVMSAATSFDLVVAHVAALRLGLVVVPVNGASPGSRDRHHRRPTARPGRGRRRRGAGTIVTDAPPGPVRRHRAAVDLPDGPTPDLDAGRARRRRAALLHVGHDRHAEGRDAHPRQHAREL